MPAPCGRRATTSMVRAVATGAILWLVASAVTASGVALSGKPPRLNACREIMKAKSDFDVYPTSSSYSCQNITFPCAAPAYPDTRNCENYYKCDSLTLTQCPCPPGQTFNIATLSCDATGSACDCAGPATSSTAAPPAPSTSTTTTASTTSVVTTVAVTAAGMSVKPSTFASAVGTTSVSNAFAGDAGADIERSPAPVVEAQLPAVAADASGSSGTTGVGVRSMSPRATTQPSSAADAATAAAGATASSAASDSSTSETSIIIAAIVCASAVTVAIVGVVVYLCHTARFRAKKDAKLPGLPCGESSSSGYTQPGTDRHLYYEIDDRAVLGSSKSFIYRPRPPPLPTTQPPAHPPCVRCLEAGGGAAGMVFAAPPPPSGKKSFPATNPHYRAAATAALGGSGGSGGELHYGSSAAFGGGGLPHIGCCGCTSELGGSGGGVVVVGGGHCHSRESSSDCSLYSSGGGGSSCSNQSTLESCVDGGDMRVPLNSRHSGSGGGSSRSTYVSKQVYI